MAEPASAPTGVVRVRYTRQRQQKQDPYSNMYGSHFNSQGFRSGRF